MADISLEGWVPLSQAAPLRYLRMRAVEKNSAKRAKRFPLPPAATPPLRYWPGNVDVQVPAAGWSGPWTQNVRNSLTVWYSVWLSFISMSFNLGRKRVIQRLFNVSVPRARVPEKASTLRDRSER